jgi:hypothetical protein
MKSLMPLFCVLFLCRRASSPLQRSAQNRYRLFQFNAYLYENILTKCLDTSRSGSLNAGALIKTGITPMKKKPLAEEKKRRRRHMRVHYAAEFSLSVCKKNTEPVFQPAQRSEICACRLWRKNSLMRARATGMISFRNYSAGDGIFFLLQSAYIAERGCVSPFFPGEKTLRIFRPSLCAAVID